MRERMRSELAMVVVGCGQVWSVVSGWGGTENPRVGGSIPPLAIRHERCISIGFANSRPPSPVPLSLLGPQTGPKANLVPLISGGQHLYSLSNGARRAAE